MWTMWGDRREVQGIEMFFHVEGDRNITRLYGGTVEPVRVELDENGSYYGYIETGAEQPDLIQPNWVLFSVQFTYGPKAEEKAGKGRIVRLSVLPSTEVVVQ